MGTGNRLWTLVETRILNEVLVRRVKKSSVRAPKAYWHYIRLLIDV